MSHRWQIHLLWMMGGLSVLVLSALFLRPLTEVRGAGLLPLRDEENGFLCYVGENQCFAFTATPSRESSTIAPSPTNTAVPPTTGATETLTATPLPSLTMSPSATSLPTSTRLPPTPIVPRLVNGNFEQIVNGNPAGWSRWNDAAWPEWKSEISPPGDSLAVRSGSASVRFIAHHSCWWYGIQQTIPAPAGRNVKVTAWFLTLGSEIASLRNADPNMNSEIGIGIDKYGLTDPQGADVSWKFAKGENLVGPLIGGNYEPVWTQMSSTVRVPADSQLITVFLSLDLGRVRTGNCMWAVPFTIGFIDDASIEVVP